MNIEMSLTDERADAELHLRETLKLMNSAIRRLHRTGLTVDVKVLGAHTSDGLMPIMSAALVDRQKGAI